MERNEKYLDFLKEIHTALKYTDKINMSDFNKRHNVSKIVYRTMVQGGIIKTNGMRSRNCRYHWTSPVEPNMAMANELIKRIRLANKEYNANRTSIEKYGPIANWDVALISNMDGLFSGLTNLNVDISKWDTSSVTDMSSMFYVMS